MSIYNWKTYKDRTVPHFIKTEKLLPKSSINLDSVEPCWN